MTLVQNVISGKNLSDAWAKALIKSHLAPRGVLAPAMVEFPAPSDGETLEDECIRGVVDEHLAGLTHPEKIETVAGTIFPYSGRKILGNYVILQI